jgi:hypothetical protein
LTGNLPLMSASPRSTAAFHTEDFGDAEAVVDLGEVDFIRTDARSFVGVLGGCPGERLERH